MYNTDGLLPYIEPALKVAGRRPGTRGDVQMDALPPAAVSARHAEDLAVEVDAATVDVVPDQTTLQPHAHAYEVPRIAEYAVTGPVHILEYFGHQTLPLVQLPVP